MSTILGRVIVTLRDGRLFDLTGLPPDVAIDRLIAAGVTPADILHTTHFVSVPLPRKEPHDSDK